MQEFLQELIDLPLRNLAVPLAVFLIVLFTGLAVRRIVFAKLRKWAASTPTPFDETLVETLYGPAFLWTVMLAIFVAADVSELPPKAAERATQTLRVLWILSLTIAGSRLAGRAVRHYGTDQSGTSQIGTLGEVLASIVAGTLGVLMLLRALGIDITALLTALGIGGLAVALALQDTLSNFFAGFYISIARQIRVGDFIQLDGGQQGYVTDIGWRSTTIRQRDNSIVVIPNNKLGQSVVTNFYLPERRMTMNFIVRVYPESDLDQVEGILLEVARGADIPGLLKQPEPNVLFIPGFGERSFEFTVVYNIAGIEDHGRVQHELRKQIVARLREAGVQFGFAPRAPELRQ